MLLQNENLCKINETVVYDAPVVKQVIKNFTPHKVYVDNKEILDSFAVALANYSPISINIVDYWNKDPQKTQTFVFVPKKGNPPVVNYANPFGMDGGGDPHRVYGFQGPSDPSLTYNLPDGRLIGDTSYTPDEGDIDNSLDDCGDDNERFFLNALIGVQDQLSFINMRTLYNVTLDASKDPYIKQTLEKYASKTGKPQSEFFSRVNNLFGNEKTATFKSYTTKKGTKTAMKYIAKGVSEGNLQGNMDILNIDIVDNDVFDYTVRSNILEELFEKFIKPLSHPIGMVYKYKSICPIQDNDVDYSLIKNRFTSDKISVRCICSAPNKCGASDTPPEKIFATKNGKGLWSGISEDEKGRKDPVSGKTLFNVLVDYQTGYDYHESLHGDGAMVLMEYKKYIFENENYLISWKQEAKSNNEAAAVQIEYYRYSIYTLKPELVLKFENNIHCNVDAELNVLKESQIIDDFTIECVASKNDFFEMSHPGLDNPDPDKTKPDKDGKYRGFAVTTNQKTYGGTLKKGK